MKSDKPTNLTSNDSKRRIFAPIHMDLVDRLTVEAETMAASLPMSHRTNAAETKKLAA